MTKKGAGENMDSEQAQGVGLFFEFDPEARAVIAVVEPVSDSAPIDEAWLTDQLTELGHGALHYLESAGSTLIAQYNQGSRVTELRIAEAVDATLAVSLSPDKMQACLDITPAEGGTSVTGDEVMTALQQLGVTDGIKFDVIDGCIAAGEAAAVIVAQGRAAVPGQDGRLECLVSQVRDRAPRVTESGRTDFRDLGETVIVHPGDPMMLRHPPTMGVPGVTVLGAKIAARAGKPVVFAKGLTGVTFSPDNPEMLVADIVGQPVQVRGGMIVEPVYTVAAVNLTTGNVVFDGTVKVVGDVDAGMTVSATGDIEIGGIAEPCKLEAGGNIVVKNGALGNIGRKDANEQSARCGGSFSAGYAQQLKVEAGDSIFIDDMVMQCEFSAKNHIRVGNGRRGYIIGGQMLASLSITGKVLGSPTRIATRFEIGAGPELHQRALELAKTRNGKENQLLEVSKLLAFAEHHPGKLPAETLERARATAAILEDEVEVLRGEATALEVKIKLARTSRVVAEQAMHEGVAVQFGKKRYLVVGEHSGCAIAPGEDGLEMFALSEINLND